MSKLFESLAAQNRDDHALSVAIYTTGNPVVAPSTPVKEPAGAVVDPVIVGDDGQDYLFEAVAQSAVTNYRAAGMAGVISWAEVGEPTADDFDLTAMGLADVNEDGDVTPEEEDGYNEILFAMTQALDSLGVTSDAVQKMLDGDDTAAAKVYAELTDALDKTDKSTDELVADFSVAKDAMTEAKAKVIRDGKVKWIRRPLRKKRLSSAQRAALKKARMKAHTAAARISRARSMKKRQQAGL